ncbi:molybdopterin-guanine dinucleotide biosynthesis protein MobB [Hydrogenophaga crassostreae]|uniref:Molybdopterin-guanine dinucleotide biosynthesis protein B n=1 Tax=Hydrogenophaga crassostreae TaxID=1763535 RepID=A0A167H3J7_9BURK|nr:molybdopterin-guanine dinucleotide biosynthesis protein B [Hydrogenophaga crassostreae]AOW13024.1 molybdopterin-guanine dinucleotide biosynthesis protein B [Hydrogenophaga crassostreae]OAD40208.1 molybdopterin-guanine dinucleotide biosynthesis protein MobB [Hydrogenophaga crassostreae]
MKVVCFAGRSGVGKTTLVEQLIPALKQLGLRVSVVKHAHHALEIDHPGKDTYRHRAAGAFEVVAASPQRLVLMREFEQEAKVSVHQMIAELYEGVDWVLVEGFRHSDLLKIEVVRDAEATAVQYPDDPFVAAIASDDATRLPVPTQRDVLPLNDAAAVAQWLVDNGDRFDYDPDLYTD